MPPGYVIGPDDVLSIVFWRDKDMSADVAVRPDGKISLPLINEIPAAGLTPEQLREQITRRGEAVHRGPERHGRRQPDQQPEGLHHRRGREAGSVPADADRRPVLQLIAMAGGLREFANGKNIVIMRTDKGQPVSLPFNYQDGHVREEPEQNIELKPGDTVVVP